MSSRKSLRTPTRSYSVRGKIPHSPRHEKPTIYPPSSAGGSGSATGQAKFKHCCRSVATFMCTQVGVGGLIVGYAIVGAFAFIAIETEESGNDLRNEMIAFRGKIVDDLYENFTQSQWSEKGWEQSSNETLLRFQNTVVESVRKGYDGRTVAEKWNFPAALMFTLSIFTMIGYGNLVPKTDWGKVLTITYACFGIPLYVLYFLNMGKALADAFKWLYLKLRSCSMGSRGSSMQDFGTQDSKLDSEPLVVPSSASIYVLIGYICIGTIMFAEWEGWEYLNSVYFCVISLSKIGLGDFVPGTSLDNNKEGNQVKLIINFVYLLLGLGLVAMCYNLLKEEVLAKMKKVKSDIKELLLLLRTECTCSK